MKYFGVASCPYCKKRVNLLRTWSLKRQGEYQCPRCSGISNIFLSPLIYVFALLAVFSGGAVYFFHKFILDDISLSTVTQVLIPFAVFFLLSLFMVHLEKPVIKKMTPAEIARKQRKERNQEQRRTGQKPVPAGVSAQQAAAPRSGTPAQAAKNGRMFYDSEEYLPRGEYHTGTLPSAAEKADMAKTAEVELPPAYHSTQARRKAPVQQGPAQRPAPARRSAAAQQQAPEQRPASAQRTVSQNSAAARSQSVQPQAVSQVVYPSGHTAVRGTPAQQAPSMQRDVSAQRTAVHSPVSVGGQSVQQQAASDDFFSKYDDPDYVARRLQEIQKEND